MPDTFIEIDPYDGDRFLPGCDLVGCGWNIIRSDGPRRLFRLVGGPESGLVFCEQHMEPEDIAAAKPLSREPRA